LTSRKGDYTFIQFGYRIGIKEAWSKTTGTWTGSTLPSNMWVHVTYPFGALGE
jgi:hypothetical protein